MTPVPLSFVAVAELTGETDSGIDLLGSDTINFFRPGKGKGKK